MAEEFLRSREKELEEKIRKEMAKERASMFGSTLPSVGRQGISRDNFGSFFGPSLPSTSTRIFEKRKANEASSSSKTILGPDPNRKQSHKQGHQPSQKKKADTLGYRSDFSFWFAGDDNVLVPKMCTNSEPNPSKCQPPSSKKNMAPSKDQRAGPTASTDSINVPHFRQRKVVKHQRVGPCQQSLPQLNNKVKRIPLKDQSLYDLIRKMLNYHDEIEEVGFDAVVREECNSTKIAKKEDGEQLRFLQEEEKRKRNKIKKD